MTTFTIQAKSVLGNIYIKEPVSCSYELTRARLLNIKRHHPTFVSGEILKQTGSITKSILKI